MSSSLPSKENALYKRVVKCCEHKQYKNGLKFAKQILSNPKFTDHGETLAMKGLILNGLGKKDEAYEHVKKGLKHDLKSSVCWHVYGLLQRSDKKYEEAIKCYRNALKIDKENIQILRDLSSLQIQIRDLDGFRESTYQIFRLRPTQRTSWVGYAVACHLLKDYDMALKALDSFGKAVTDEFELSEILLYQTMLQQESGDNEGAIDLLIQNQNKICDKLSLEETLSKLYLEANKYKQADEQICKLLKRNPDNVNYYDLLSKARNSQKDDAKVLLIEEFINKYPKSSTPRRLLLTYSTGEYFKTAMDAYLKAGLVKGVPSLFVDVKNLYKDQEKAIVMENLVLEYVKSLEKNNTFDGKEPQPITALLWTYYYLAQHYDFKKLFDEALYYINIAIDHTPTLIELYVVKAKIYKHAGNVYEACKYMDEAQSFDTADRYINSKCAKYMIRANMIQEAVNICSNFTIESEDVMTYLNDIECMSFQLECASAYQRMENWGESLKKCHEIDRHFTQIVDDQFDFHSYCLKKMTLRSYVKLLRLEDVIRSHRFYLKAAHCAIKIYMKLHDQPLEKKEKSIEVKQIDIEPMELKKLKNKQRKAQKKAESKIAQESSTAVKRDTHKFRQASDPDYVKKAELIPEQLANEAKPLEQAIKFLKPLQQLASNKIETHLLSYEVYFRMNKLLLMLRSVKRAWNTNKNHPLVHYILIHFCKHVSLWKLEKSISQQKITVIDRVMEPILKGKTPIELNNEFLNEHKNDLTYLHQGAKVMYMLEPARQNDALKLVTCLDENLSIKSMDACAEVLESLKNGDFGPCEDSRAQYRASCNILFPHATAFLISEEKELVSEMKKLMTDSSQTKQMDNTEDKDKKTDSDEELIYGTNKSVNETPSKTKQQSARKSSENIHLN